MLVLQNHRFQLDYLLLDTLLMKVHILVDLPLSVDDGGAQESLDFAEELSGLMFECLVTRGDFVLVVLIY